MAVSKKGWRKITVNKQLYFWRAIGSDWGISVIVVTDAAFISGKSAQKLTFTLDYDHLYIPYRPGVFRLKQQAIVSPAVVSLAIEQAASSNPTFTGDFDAENICLTGSVLALLQQQARIDKQIAEFTI